MYVRVEGYFVLDQLQVNLVVLAQGDSPTGERWTPVLASTALVNRSEYRTAADLVSLIADELHNMIIGQ